MTIDNNDIKLLQFQLFQGMSQADLMTLLGQTRFGFAKHPAGRRIVSTGSPCTQLLLLTSGTLRAETSTDDGKCRVVEQLTAPFIVQPERLFGSTPRYTSTFTTLTPVSLVTLDKQEILQLTERLLVFRLNLLNLLSTETQRHAHQPWRTPPADLRKAIVRYFVQHVLHPAGAKTFHTLMKHLALALNDSRLNISMALNAMQDKGLLTLHRGRIEIPSIERLLT